MTKPTKTRGIALLARVTGAYALDATESEILTEACRLLDHLDRVQEAVLAEPLTSPGSTGQPTAAPLLAELRAGRRQLLEMLAALRLPATEEPDPFDALAESLSRPTGGGSS